jgi:hypothetical protein
MASVHPAGSLVLIADRDGYRVQVSPGDGLIDVVQMCFLPLVIPSR